MTITPDDIYNLIHKGEGASVEIKKCSNTLPRSVWETYSAFANTRGGVMLLGITEHKERPIESRFEITGVSDPDKIETDFFNILNNRQKVSRNILFDSDFRQIVRKFYQHGIFLDICVLILRNLKMSKRYG